MPKKPSKPASLKLLPPLTEEEKKIGLAVQIMKQKKVTKRGMANFVEQVLTSFAPYIVPEMMQALRRGALSDDPTMVRMGLETFGAIQGKSGINITNVNSNSATANSGSDAKSFDSIARQLAVEKQIVDISPVEAS